MIGSPSESREEILNTINYAKKLDAEYVHFAILTPFPNTQIYDESLKRGIFKEDYWKEFARNPTANFKPRVFEDTLNRGELLELLRYAYKSFYLRPGYIMKRIMRIRSIGELKRKFSAGTALLKK